MSGQVVRIAVATSGPIPGICLSRSQAGSDEAICSIASFMQQSAVRDLPLAPEKADQITHADFNPSRMNLRDA